MGIFVVAWVPLKKKKKKRVNNIYRELGMRLWELAGHRLWRLPPSWFWNDWSEVTEVMAVR